MELEGAGARVEGGLLADPCWQDDRPDSCPPHPGAGVGVAAGVCSTGVELCPGEAVGDCEPSSGAAFMAAAAAGAGFAPSMATGLGMGALLTRMSPVTGAAGAVWVVLPAFRGPLATGDAPSSVAPRAPRARLATAMNAAAPEDTAEASPPVETIAVHVPRCGVEKLRQWYQAHHRSSVADP